MYRGPAATIKRTRIGVLLRPSPPSGGELLGIRLPRSAMTGGGPAGHGIYVVGGAWEQFQTAWPG
jgi:S-DNA-T family DNA segregation ATPase FtsK/SpoIIIE